MQIYTLLFTGCKPWAAWMLDYAYSPSRQPHVAHATNLIGATMVVCEGCGPKSQMWSIDTRTGSDWSVALNQHSILNYIQQSWCLLGLLELLRSVHPSTTHKIGKICSLFRARNSAVRQKFYCVHWTLSVQYQIKSTLNCVLSASSIRSVLCLYCNMFSTLHFPAGRCTIDV